MAFEGLDVALRLLTTAYGLVTGSGENVLETVHRQVSLLRKAVDDAVDGLN